MNQKRFAIDMPVRLPQPPAPAVAPGGFMLCPVGAFPGLTLEQWLWQQHVYRLAFEEAVAVARPSILERDLLAVWN
jgi:hypothetical protein